MITYLQMIETDEERSKFEQIYKEYKGLMYHVACERLHNEQDAEDAVQHAFVKIAENIDRIGPIGSKTKQLVVTIVDNRVTDIFRVRGRHPTVEYDELANILVEQDGTEDLLTSCMLKLPDIQRHVIWLKYYHGYTLREIAKLLGLSLSNAQKIDQRAKKKLSEVYEAAGGSL